MAQIIATSSNTAGGTADSLATITTTGVLLTDDLFFIFIESTQNGSTGADITLPSGWTEYRNDTQGEIKKYAFYRVATADNETYPDFTLSKSVRWCITAVAIRGAHASPLGAFAKTASNGANDPTMTGITTTAENSIILTSAGIERRVITQIDETVGRPNMVQKENVTTATTQEGTDNSLALAIDFEHVNSTVVAGAYVDTANGGDFIGYTLEIKSAGVIIPAYLITKPIKVYDTFAVSANTQDFRIQVADSSGLIDDATPNTWTFDSSAVSVALDTIPVTAHGIPSGRVVRLEANGATLPTGITDDAFYFVESVDANTIKLRLHTEVSSSSDLYENVSTTDITIVGTGTCLIRDVGLVRTGTRPVAYDTTSACLRENYFGGGYYYENSVFTGTDFTGFAFAQFLVSDDASTYPSEVLGMLIDSVGNWKAFKIHDNALSTIASSEGRLTQISPECTVFLSESPTAIDETDVYQVILLAKLGVSGEPFSPLNYMNNAEDNIYGQVTLVGGTTTNKLTFTEFNNLMNAGGASGFSKREFQVASFGAIKIGDTGHDIFLDSPRSSILTLAPANGTTLFDTYRSDLQFVIAPSAGSYIDISNSQIGSSFASDILIESLPTVATDLNINGCSFLNAKLTLAINQDLDRCSFVGGLGLFIDGGDLSNCSFDSVERTGGAFVLEDVGTLTNCSISNAVDGLEIGTAGDYNISEVSFSGNTNDISVTATSGIVNLTLGAGQPTPTTTTAGATVNLIVASKSLTLTGLQANSEVRIYEAGTTTELGGVENSGASFGPLSLSENSVDIIVFHIDYQPVRLLAVDTTISLTLPIQQIFDRNYENP